MINTIGIALSGLTGAAKKAGAAAANIAHMQTTGRRDGQSPLPYNAVTTASSSTARGGVQTAIIPKDPAFVPSYRPDSPFADEAGYVGAPAVDLAAEAVNLKLAETAYKANLAVIRTADEMQDELLRAFDREV